MNVYGMLDYKRKIHELYVQCKKAMLTGEIVSSDVLRFESQEEELFYKTVFDFFLQQKKNKLSEQSNFKDEYKYEFGIEEQ